ncbi:MAG: glycosyltransferase family 39 protein [Cytophagales bacterium]|nr:glycosyltransferase family 39 protein [Cytophagales bacterium]
MLPEFHQHQKIAIPLGLFLLAGLALFINLGSYPLFLEEPRRALIALEMYLSDQWMVPTQFGEAYFKKPPIWNWVILFSHTIFGDFSEWTIRFFGVVSFLLMGVITWWVGDKYVNFSFGVHAALLVLTMADALYYLTVVSGEIDLFYSLITYAGIVLIFFLREKGEFAWMFFLGYVFAAIGLLTKGLPSLVFLAITLLIALWDGYRLKKLWSAGHLLGIVAFAAIIGWFAWSYTPYGEVSQYITTLWTESRDKTAVGTFNAQRFLVHLVLFPLETLKNILPAGFLLLFAWRKSFWDQLRSHRLIRFSFWVSLTNILLYWLSPETGSRYLYMLYPFIIIVLLYAFHLAPTHVGRDKAFKVIGLVVLGLFFTATVSYPFILTKQVPDGAMIASLMVACLMPFLIYGFLKLQKWRLLLIMTGFLLIRVVFDFSVHPLRAQDSPMQEYKQRGIQLTEVAEDHPIFIYKDTRISYTSAFYTTRESKRVIRRTENKEFDGLYLVREDLLKGEEYQVRYLMPYRDTTVYLVRFR